MSCAPFKGIGIGIVGPSGYAIDAAAVGRATSCLLSLGFHVRDFTDPLQRVERFAASDDARGAQLHAAACADDVDVVVALRGGYGLSRLLPHLDLCLLANSGKRFVGHSDFTALHMALLAQCGATSFAGPMICDDFSRDEPSAFTIEQFCQCMSRDRHTVRFSPGHGSAIDVEGILWGGNLTMLAHLVGTPYLPHVRGGILFIEDVNEHPYRVERMLLQLQHAGLLDQKAIVFGDFSNYRLGEYDNGYDFDAMLRYLRQATGIPMVTGLPFGHTRDKATLAVGAQARLLVCDGQAILSMSGYPVRSAA